MARKNNRKKEYRNINFLTAIMCFAVMVVVVLVLLSCVGNREEEAASSQEPVSDISEAAESSVAEPIISEPEESSVPDMTFSALVVENSDIHKGDLVIANPSHPLPDDTAETIVSVYGNKNSTYKVADLSVTYSERLMPTLNKMLSALHDITLGNGLTMSAGYRTISQQQTIHESAKNTNGREPAGGCSDLNTGLSFNAWVYPSTEGNIREGKYLWLAEHCYEYGYVVRYPSGKSNLTGIDASSDYYVTYRYVGMPHSYLMFVNDYCLEEYMEFVMRFSYENRYSFEKDNIEYEIYYVPVSEGETTAIPVPTDYDYTVSGDNIGGFVVTVTK